ncbi:MFS transporter [Compostimonas suwonensis]|uniref:EmrB/QacA subfamily drug resistance transporter n=1 Tax=Compostimonas suwonensis TaxID=1048394 RepID=A0A2M9BUL2_9MICO|nr:MFS transporter [Compostimonas suwonensis]PJJ61641.1 EmrB/QacA subfamily drug resistance transporter [Compostimonas suwonensis]
MTTPAPEARAASPVLALSPRRAWWALVVLMAGAFMSLLDTTIVNVALPSIRDSLDASSSTLEWIISGYALAFGLTLIPAGRLGDRYGHKWIFIIGLTVFTLASLACGLAQDSVQLIVARVVQGAAGGFFFPAITALIQIMFQGRGRGKAFGVLGAVLGFSSALGPLVGGLIIEAFGVESGWRLVFGVNLPIGIVALVAAAVLLPAIRLGGAVKRVDVVGLLLLTVGLVAVLVPLIEGQSEDWPLWTYLSIAGGLIALVLFALWELRVVRRGGDPIVPPHLFSHPAFSGGVILATVYFAAFTSIFFTLTLLWQAGLGATALESGLVVMPFAIGTIVGAARSDFFAARLGRAVLVIGVGMLSLGLAAVWLLLVLIPTPELTGWELAAPLLVAGIGSGLFIAPNTSFIVATVDRQEAGAASGILGTVQRIGSAIGIAVIGSVLFGTLVIDPSTGPDAVADGFGRSAQLAMGVSVVFALVAFVLVFTLPKRVPEGAGH